MGDTRWSGTVVEIGGEDCLITPIGNIILNGSSPDHGAYRRRDLVALAKDSGPRRFFLTHNSLDAYLQSSPRATSTSASCPAPWSSMT